jgi:MOSC domain-containing protein YiiM
METVSVLKVISVNVGLPREITWKGRIVSTGIFKEPVAGRVAVRRLNLDGDRHADLTVHGGPDKAVYVYPSEYYQYWREQFPDMDLPWGMFGENLTVQGIVDARVFIGDQFRVGSALLEVRQPRLPCYKLGIKFQRDDILKRFLKSELTGFYFAVREEGEVAAGDTISLVSREAHGVSVTDITRLNSIEKRNQEKLRRAIAVRSLPEDWREYFSERLQHLSNS